MEPVYSPVIGTAVGLFKVMGWKVHVSGAHNIPLTGAAILASNHIGYLDFIVVGYGAREAKRLVRFAAKKEVFDHPVGGPLMRGMKHLPVDRDGDAMAIMVEAQRRLDLGQVVGMFPEGTISRSFMPAQGMAGTARMALAAGVPLIPTAVWGCQRLSTKAVTKNLQRNIEIRVAFGPPIPYTQDDEPRDVGRLLMDKITEMVVEHQEAYTQVPAGPKDTWWQPAHLGGSAPTTEEAEQMIRQERIDRRKLKKALAAQEKAELARQGEGQDEG